MIKIFSTTKTIYLIDSQSSFKPSKDAVLYTVQSKKEITNYLSIVKNDTKTTTIYFLNPDLNWLFESFSDNYKYIEAAGGLVKNDIKEWLFIFRNGVWDLPKGKIEKGEAINIAAIREVEEECGISSLEIIKEIPSTYHIYFQKNKEYLKRTYWFEMICRDFTTPKPQIEEGITEVKWVSDKNLKQIYNNTFESIKDVLKAIE